MFALLVATAGGITMPPAPACADGEVTIKAVPSTVDLSARKHTKATVVVANGTESPLSGLRLEPALDGAWPERATIKPGPPRSLAAGQARTYTLDLRPWTNLRSPSPISLIGRYRAGGVRRVAATSIALSAPAALEVDKIATVEVKASLETLRSGETEKVYLLVNNKSSHLLTVEGVRPRGPDFIEFLDRPENVEVAPGEIGVLDLEAKADPRVDPGSHQLIFELPVAIGRDRFDLVATQAAKVGVTGESELLTVLGVPSLLLLPGFLLVATASLLWRFRFLRKDWDDESFPLPPKEAEFWLVAVLASIVAVLLAKYAGGIDLFGRYGLQDLIRIWAESMLAGAAAYVAIVLARNKIRSARVPSEGDAPWTVLEKLAEQGLDLERPRFAYDSGSGSIPLYLLQSFSETRPSTWASPRVNFEWTGDVDVALNESIQAQLDDTHDAAALARDLRRGADDGSLTVEFEGGRPPLLVEKAKIGVATPTVMAGEK